MPSFLVFNNEIYVVFKKYILVKSPKFSIHIKKYLSQNNSRVAKQTKSGNTADGCGVYSIIIDKF